MWFSGVISALIFVRKLFLQDATRRLLQIVKSCTRPLTGISYNVSQAASSLSRPIEGQIHELESTRLTSVESFDTIDMPVRQPTGPTVPDGLLSSEIRFRYLRATHSNALAGALQADSSKMEHRSHWK